MTEQLEKNIMELRAIPDLLDRNYFIPEYQRGYRWGTDQVVQLLNDLLFYFRHDNGTASFYCLQPIVVKVCTDETKRDNDLDDDIWYEVIDGQQRLTTVRIICSIIDSMGNRKGHKFRIRYATRPDMDKIYENLKAEYNEDSEKFELLVFKDWNNLDSVYIKNAACQIIQWFNEDEEREGLFKSFFFNRAEKDKSVQVVWYEDCGEKDARDLFNEINDLSVKLSSSELIRSLFLSSEASYECDINLEGIEDNIKQRLLKQNMEEQQRYINTKWNEIEHRLSDKRLQQFVSNTCSENRRNNIELLFDIISHKNAGKKEEDPLHTFIFFNDEIKKIGATTMWKRVEKYYSRICGWMEDRELYHKIGFLNAIGKGDATIIALFDFAEKHKKNELSDEVNRRIRESMKTPSGKKLSELDYRKSSDYEYIRKLLFLYCVELNRKMKNYGFFPFELFKPLNNWTLEHIHAQNSDCLPTDKKAIWIEWIKGNANTLRSLHFDKDIDEARIQLITDLSKYAKKFEEGDSSATHTTIVKLFDQVAKFYDSVNNDNMRDLESINTDPEHQLSNMTLLSQSVNSSIGCSAFAVKRENIIKLHNNGEYFPLGTLQVFEKTMSDSHQLYEWSISDREAYMESLKNILGFYLTLD